MHYSDYFSLLCLYLLSQHFQFFCPGLDVRQSVTDFCGLLSHASGSVHDGRQSAVSQLLDLDIQRCQVGAALQLRCWETEGAKQNFIHFSQNIDITLNNDPLNT